MSSILFSLPELYSSYRNWVSQNPLIASDYETTAKWVSYFIAGRINNSHVVSELIYALSNLLVLFNDRIIKQIRQRELPASGDKLKLWLTTVEYAEVFFELSAKKLWGESGKWLVIVAVQIFKCICRLILVFKHKETIVPYPAIPVLQRKDVILNDSLSDTSDIPHESVSFTLRRSGRIVRKVNGSPSLLDRTWQPVKRTDALNNEQIIEKSLMNQQLIAEVIYILKPVVHLASAASFGNNTWKPWMIALLMDAASLHLYGTLRKVNPNVLTKNQVLAISKRKVMLLMYLLRSPFYDKHSKDRINALLMSLSKNLPLVGIICNPINQYLPFWQSTYFYMWST